MSSVETITMSPVTHSSFSSTSTMSSQPQSQPRRSLPSTKQNRRRSQESRYDSPTVEPREQVRGDWSKSTDSTDPLNASVGSQGRGRKRNVVFDDEDEDEDDITEVHNTPPPKKRAYTSTTAKSHNPKFVQPTKNNGRSAGSQPRSRGSPPRREVRFASNDDSGLNVDVGRAGIPTATRHSQPRPPIPTTRSQRVKTVSVIRRTDSREGQNSDDNDVDTVIEYTKSEANAMLELENVNRHHYLVGLDRDRYTPPARQVFPTMSINNAIFKAALKKTRRDFKNWKAAHLKNIAKFTVDFIDSYADDTIKDETDFKALRRIINAEFQYHWFPIVFNKSYPVVDYELITPLGRAFLRYACVQLMVHTRLYMIYNETQEPTLQKYNRTHLIDFYDGLHRLKEFRDLSLDDFPLRDVPLSIVHSSSRQTIDPNDDSDGEVEDDFFEEEIPRSRSRSTASEGGHE